MNQRGEVGVFDVVSRLSPLVYGRRYPTEIVGPYLAMI